MEIDRAKVARTLAVLLLISLAARILLAFAYYKHGLPKLAFFRKLPGIIHTGLDFVAIPANAIEIALPVLVGLLAPKIWKRQELPLLADMVAAILGGLAAVLLPAKLYFDAVNYSVGDQAIQDMLYMTFAAIGAVAAVVVTRMLFGTTPVAASEQAPVVASETVW